ncbi:putative WRKY transcription factor 20 [Forsythia ovata]|uniref:WRKY transcription factor 20 n=1 Tax=Forsythia ovata TaxID=205694 RepID=A0ABD1NYF7_9LAMI
MEDSQPLPHSPSDNFSNHVTDGGSSATGASAAVLSAGVTNGAKYRLMSPAKLPISRSTSITIPPGLSPTSFLESPVLLSNIKAEPSPTTGSFFKSQLMQGSGESSALLLDKHCSGGNAIDQGTTSSFEFKFHSGSSSAPGLSSMGVAIPAGLNRQQNGPCSQVQDQLFSQSSASSSFVTCELPSSKDLRVSAPTSVHTSSVCDAVDELNRGGQPNTRIQVSSSDNKDSVSLVTAERTSDDGYNWRKYGQKLVKGCEFPRSYYKCTYPNCEVRKFFERSPSGQITEIVYKGSHDHPKPQPARRYNSGALVSIQEEKLDKDVLFTNQQDKLNTNTLGSSVEPNKSPMLSLQQANEDGLDGTGSEFQAIDEDDTFSKRRKIEDDLDVTPVVKPIRDARVVVQTVSEVDVLDDGYRWRKYGQKVVRGNPNPRSYYKCTNTGCPVRKHVERASHDLKAVITTYEGKHNHDVPTAKNSSHEFAGSTPFSGTLKLKPEDKGSISLDLGVGISQNQTNGQLRNLNAETAQTQIPPSDSSMMIVQPSQIPPCYGFVNGGLNLYGNREKRAEGHNFQSPPVHASSQCPQNLGRILMGP